MSMRMKMEDSQTFFFSMWVNVNTVKFKGIRMKMEDSRTFLLKTNMG